MSTTQMRTFKPEASADARVVWINTLIHHFAGVTPPEIATALAMITMARTAWCEEDGDAAMAAQYRDATMVFYVAQEQLARIFPENTSQGETR